MNFNYNVRNSNLKVAIMKRSLYTRLKRIYNLPFVKIIYQNETFFSKGAYVKLVQAICHIYLNANGEQFFFLFFHVTYIYNVSSLRDLPEE